MSTEDRIKRLQAQIEVLQAKQADLNKQLVQAEVERWQGRIDDIELQIHLGAMETNDRVRELLDQLRRRWTDAKAQIEGTTSAAGEGVDQVRASLQTAYKDIRQVLLDTKSKITS
jgi:membrane protein involved in colicin uptake